MNWFNKDRPLVLAGPCAAESLELMKDVASFLKDLSQELGFDYVFKASFDKANRTSGGSKRGPGLERALGWFETLKKSLEVPVVTDVHESHQVPEVAAVVDLLQIPAFLCRQTDLVVAAAQSGRAMNIKKGQFMAPEAMGHIYAKAKESQPSSSKAPIFLTERGASFGYGNLVVDPRSFPLMAAAGAPVLFDITHSTQLPSAGSGGQTSAAQRRFAPVLARAATGTGYLSGYFLEVHSNPSAAISDKDAQLDKQQAEALLRQLIPLWHKARDYHKIDAMF